MTKKETSVQRCRRIAMEAARKSENLFLGVDHTCPYGEIGRGRYIRHNLSRCTMCLAQYLEHLVIEKWLR